MMRPDSRAWLRLLSVAAWTTALVLGEDGSASSAGTLELLRAMQQQMNGMEQQMNGMESRIASLEADNRRLRAAPRAANADPAAESWAVGPLGNGRRLEQQSCCRWTNSGACPSADVTYKCTSLHEYLETKTTTHVFEDVSACPGSDPSALFQGESANVALSSGGSEVIRVPTPLKVIHPANCTGATMEIQLNTSVPSLLVGNLDVEGTLTVGGVDVSGGGGPTVETIDALNLATVGGSYLPLSSVGAGGSSWGYVTQGARPWHKSITLTEEKTVMAYYSVGWGCFLTASSTGANLGNQGSLNLITALRISGGSPAITTIYAAKSFQGAQKYSNRPLYKYSGPWNSQTDVAYSVPTTTAGVNKEMWNIDFGGTYGTNTGMWTGTLPAGTYDMYVVYQGYLATAMDGCINDDSFYMNVVIF